MKIIEITVGRSEDCSVCLPHDSIRRRHCTIYVQGPKDISIKDTGSTNGTKIYINGEWRQIKNAMTVELDTQIMMGEYTSNVRRLLSGCPDAMSFLVRKNTPPPPSKAPPPPKAPSPPPSAPQIRRDPNTGEIIKK